MYFVVQFVVENALEIIPKSWINGPNECFWPPKHIAKMHELGNFIKKRRSPDNTWSRFKIQIISEAETFEEARKKLKKASEKDDLENIKLTSESEDYGRGKRQKQTLPLTSDSSDEESNVYRRIKRMLPESEEESESLIRPTPLLRTVDGNKKKCGNSGIRPQGFASTSKTSQEAAPVTQVSETEGMHFTSALDNAKNESVDLDGDGTEKSNDALKTILTNQRLMKLEIQSLRQEIETLVDVCSSCRCKQSNDPARQVVNLGNFPLTSEDDLQKLEDVLCTDVAQKYMVQKLQSYGGNNYGDHTRRIMRHLFTDELAEMFNWMGAKKQKFSNLKISSLIVDAVCEKEKISRKSVEDVIKTWLRHAKERKNYFKKNA